ncbi:FtsK/SpoIIIE domain-containing protein [Longispora albida]|uniref:FtsK/SpoIIIE domain-containing protein n=1 Tax=Longispora albida TaxID=203523 RepID=UPI0003706368|nr:FtsK/SpoIIIE domain-containing protein [Longispora albida]
MMRRRNRGRRFGRHDPQPLYLITHEGGTVFALIGAVFRAMYRYRSELAPIWAAIVVFLTGVWLHAAHQAWWPWLTALSVTLTAVLGVLPRWVGHMRRWAALDRPAERAYATGAAGATAGWLAAAAGMGSMAPPLPLLWLVGLVVLGAPWWAHHRRRAKVRVERSLAAWPHVADAVGLSGSYIQSAIVGRWGYTFRLGLKRGQTAQNVIAAIPSIESELATRPGAIRVEIDPERADKVTVRVIETDPHAEPITYTPIPAGSASITKPVPLGVYEDGDAVSVSMLRRNALVGGVIGSGKSGVLNTILAHLVSSPDCAVWGIDLKGGMELGPWLPCLDRLATNPQQVLPLLQDAFSVLHDRARTLAERGERVWNPTPENPALVIVIDEFAELPEEAMPIADSIARLGRAVAVNFLIATQRPTQKAMGRSAIRSQMDIRLGLRVVEKGDGDLILSQGMVKNGWHLHTLDAAGKFLLSSPEHRHPKRARATLTTDDDVKRVVAANENHRPAITVSGTEERRKETRPAIPGQRKPAGNRTPEETLWAALQAAPPIGISVGDLMDITRKGRTWVYDRLQEHAQAGRAERTARGYWKAKDATR